MCIRDRGAFTALFVETPDYQVMSEEDVKRLRNNMHPVSYTHLDVYKRQVVYMVESNFQRTTILPSEKAFAYKMRLEAMKRQAGRPQRCV